MVSSPNAVHAGQFFCVASVLSRRVQRPHGPHQPGSQITIDIRRPLITSLMNDNNGKI